MAGEIQVNSVTALTESGSNIVLNNVDTATNRTNLGLGSIATQAADSVSISGGNITGGTIGSGVVFPAGTVIGAAFLAEVVNGDAGTFTASTQTLRNLNTVVYTSNCSITLSSSEFSFDSAGSYIIQASAPAWFVTEHIASIYQDTGSVLIARGTSANSTDSFSVSSVYAKVTISSDEITSGLNEKTFGIYHICNTTKASNGLGDASPQVTDEQYTQTLIYRVAL